MNGVELEPDAKSQVTLRYENGKPVEVVAIVVSHQHKKKLGESSYSQKRFADLVRPYAESVFPAGLITKKTKWHINPTGKFEIGGPDGDSGLTGRKIIVDTYGGASPHGGGAFSGKDPTKVDRSAAYACRYLAKNVVAAGLAERCTIQISYAIGVAAPTSFYVDLHGADTIDPAHSRSKAAGTDGRLHAARDPHAFEAQSSDLRAHCCVRPLRPPAGQRRRLHLGTRRSGGGIAPSVVRRRMSSSLGLTPEIVRYLADVNPPEHPALKRCREETARMSNAQMQISAEQGAFMQSIARMIRAKRAFEVGVFTGYSSLATALALKEMHPVAGAHLLACDVSEDYTTKARDYWREAEVDDVIELKIAPATETLDQRIAAGQGGSYDIGFIDADKTGYDSYYERGLLLLRPGGVMLFDNVLWSGRVADPADTSADTTALRALAYKAKADSRVHASMNNIGDGVLICVKK